MLNFLRNSKCFINGVSFNHLRVCYKHSLDYSYLPIVLENELEEKFVKGGGPGGQAVNKSSNCVQLTHKPTGLVIKCQKSRCLDENRKMARELLVSRLDNLQNGPNSISAQKQRLLQKKSKSANYKRNKSDILKAKWKEREGL